MAGLIDLHLHTTHSDGMLSPAQVLDAVRDTGLTAFAITDHDTIGGYLEIKSLVQPNDAELVSGLELSVAIDRGDLHLLAYLFDPESEELTSSLKSFQRERNQRGRRMVEKLNELGVPLEFDRVVEAASGSAIGRPHIADAMVKQGLVSCFEQAFKKHIGDRCPAYMPKSRLEPREAIDLVHRTIHIVSSRPKNSNAWPNVTVFCHPAAPTFTDARNTKARLAPNRFRSSSWTA
jgi:predicted metal-dependent phosphoesterase TrpH